MDPIKFLIDKYTLMQESFYEKATFNRDKGKLKKAKRFFAKYDVLTTVLGDLKTLNK